jgi:hypothetical protein
MIKLTLLLLRYIREITFIPALSHFLPDRIIIGRCGGKVKRNSSSNNGTVSNFSPIELDLLLF